MKTFILIIALAFSFSAMGQVMDTVTYINCEVVVIGSFGDRASDAFKQVVLIDFGGGRVFGADNPLKDSMGRIIDLRSSADALNFLESDRWRLQTSTSVYYGNKLIHHHFLKKRKFGG